MENKNIGQKAKGAVEDVANTQFESQKEKAFGGLTQVAQAIRQSGEHLRDQRQDQMARYAHKAAEQVERFSNYLRSTNIREMIGEIENVARREPALFLGGAFTLGLLGARFLKSSSAQSKSSSRQSSWQGREYADFQSQREREPFATNRGRPSDLGQPIRPSGSGIDVGGTGMDVDDRSADIREH